MKTTLEPEDIQGIAERVVELIRPVLSRQPDTGKAMKKEIIYGHRHLYNKE
jgi:hypothetical protein